MSKPNRETPRIVFVFGLWIYLALVSSILLCAWRAFRSPTALSPGSSSAPILEALIFLLTGSLILFLWHIYRAIGLISFKVNSYLHISFPWRITSCLATLSALVCIFVVQSHRKQAPIVSTVLIRSEPQMFSKIDPGVGERDSEAEAIGGRYSLGPQPNPSDHPYSLRNAGDYPQSNG